MIPTPEQRAEWREDAGRALGRSSAPKARLFASRSIDLVDALDQAEGTLTAIRDRDEEVCDDEGWHIGGAWGDYGEVVVPLRVLSYVIGGELDQKVVSTDPGYAATYAEQTARADRAEAERDAALARIERVREVHRAVEVEPSATICGGCSTRRGQGDTFRYFPYVEWPCPTIRALDGEVE